MLRALGSAIFAVMLLFIVPEPAEANLAPKSIGVAGETTWPEIEEVINKLRYEYGIPIHSNCLPQDTCVVVSHYSSAIDSQYAYAAFPTRKYGEGEIHLNNHYHQGRWQRMHLLFHEFGHILGLPHLDSCDTAMQTYMGLCGHVTIGYTSEEQQQLRGMWS